MKYDDIRSQLKTGDVILFSGEGGISDGIKFFTRSRYSHVGIVYRFSDPRDPEGTVFCWESTTLSDLTDADTGKATMGVQRVELSERLERCFAKGYAIRIRPLAKALTDPMVEALNAFRHEVSGRPYEKSVLDLLRAAYDGFLGANREDLSSLFCSELVAEAFQRMGLLSDSIPSDEYTPKDFSAEGRMRLLNGYDFKKEIPVTAL
jgi:hypothetical protein